MNIQVRSNVFGDIMKIRKGVIYKEITAVVDELLQNCQRAKAKNILIFLSDSELVVEDDGIGCDDPQSFFEKSTTGWDNLDEAFGEGFFSVFLLADVVSVWSRNWMVTVDVPKMLETKNDQFRVVEHMQPHVKGTRIVISGPKIATHYSALLNEIHEIGSVLPQNVTLNGNTLIKRDILDVSEICRHVDPELIVHFENDLYEANLYPINGYTKLQLYYEGRPVAPLYMASNIGGKIVMKRDALTLRAPDRKDVVYDSKYSLFSSSLSENVSEVYKNVIRYSSDEMLDRYETGISAHLEPVDYVSLLKFDSDMYYEDAHKAKATEDSDSSSTEEQLEEPISVVSRHILVEFTEQLHISKSELKIRIKEEGGLQKLAGQNGLFWVKEGDIPENVEELVRLKYYGAKVIIARNTLYEKALEYLGIPEVDRCGKMIRLQHACKDTPPATVKQNEVYSLIQDICDAMALPRDLFKFANVMITATYKNSDTPFNTFRALGATTDDGIYIDVSGIKWLSERRSKVATVKILFQLIGVMAHELAHYCHQTVDGTAMHFEMTELYTKYIGEAICKLED